jgi:hypothetical protein
MAGVWVQESVGDPHQRAAQGHDAASRDCVRPALSVWRTRTVHMRSMQLPASIAFTWRLTADQGEETVLYDFLGRRLVADKHPRQAHQRTRRAPRRDANALPAVRRLPGPPGRRD